MNLHLRGVVLPEGEERDVFVEGGRFRSRRPSDARTVWEGGFLLPGLADVHVHLALREAGPRAVGDPVTISAREHLQAGVLALREPGGPRGSSHGVGPDRGLPRLATGGRFLAPAGGYLPGRARETPDEELPAAAELEARSSGAWAKVIGDWPAGGRWSPNYRPGTLASAAERVHAAGGRLAVHAFTPEVVDAAVAAGVDSLEHASLAEPGQLEEMAGTGTALVPTMSILPGLEALAESLGCPPAEVRRVRRGVDRHPRHVRLAREAGVTVLAGTDAGVTRHGAVAAEVAALVAAGIAPEAAVGAASWEARRFLHLPGIEDGAPADVVTFGRDPRRDPGVLARPRVIVLAGAVIDGGY